MGPALRQAVVDSSAYYLLGYSSSQAPDDGKFHEISVKVKRPRADVRARKGYWAFTAAEISRITSPTKPVIAGEVTNALASLELPRRSRVVRTWLGTSRGSNGKTRVTFYWEPAPVAPGERRDVPSQVNVTALGEDGAPYYRGRVANGAAAKPAPGIIDLGTIGGGGGGGSAAGAGGGPQAAGASGGATAGTSSVGAGAMAGGRVEFEAKPGPMRMRLSVEGDGGRVLDSDQLDVTLVDFTAPQVQMSTPMVIRARTMPELRSLTNNLAAPPTTERTFRRSERVLIRLNVYGPGSSTPTVTAQVLNRAGDPMMPVTVDLVQGQADLRQMAVPLANLSPGDYLVEVVAKGDESQAKELVAFRVGA